MCGLSGEFRFDGGPPDLEGLDRISAVMEPRGPDGHGRWHEGPVALAHRRLKIIDLTEAGAQPMVDTELGLVTVFNGCIYNYRQLREELAGYGYRFFSTSDTEVIGKAYHRWGIGCVDHFMGMFAFAVLERASGRLILARDRLGIKPLYLAQTPERLRFASSLPALLAGGGIDTSVDPVALNFYLSFHAVVPPPYTILRGVRKLPPATVRVVEPDGTSTDRLYWSPDHQRADRYTVTSTCAVSGRSLGTLRIRSASSAIALNAGAEASAPINFVPFTVTTTTMAGFVKGAKPMKVALYTLW